MQTCGLVRWSVGWTTIFGEAPLGSPLAAPQAQFVPKGFPELVVREMELQPVGDSPSNQAAYEGNVQFLEGNERGYDVFLALCTLA